MIFEALITTVLTITYSIFELFNVPDMPTAITTAASYLSDVIIFAVSFLKQVLTPTLLSASVIVLVAVFYFETLYHGIMWVIRKIPMINIK